MTCKTSIFRNVGYLVFLLVAGCGGASDGRNITPITSTGSVKLLASNQDLSLAYVAADVSVTKIGKKKGSVDINGSPKIAVDGSVAIDFKRFAISDSGVYKVEVKCPDSTEDVCVATMPLHLIIKGSDLKASGWQLTALTELAYSSVSYQIAANDSGASVLSQLEYTSNQLLVNDSHASYSSLLRLNPLTSSNQIKHSEKLSEVVDYLVNNSDQSIKQSVQMLDYLKKMSSSLTPVFSAEAPDLKVKDVAIDAERGLAYVLYDKSLAGGVALQNDDATFIIFDISNSQQVTSIYRKDELISYYSDIMVQGTSVYLYGYGLLAKIATEDLSNIQLDTSYFTGEPRTIRVQGKSTVSNDGTTLAFYTINPNSDNQKIMIEIHDISIPSEFNYYFVEFCCNDDYRLGDILFFEDQLLVSSHNGFGVVNYKSLTSSDTQIEDWFVIDAVKNNPADPFDHSSDIVGMTKIDDYIYLISKTEIFVVEKAANGSFQLIAQHSFHQLPTEDVSIQQGYLVLTGDRGVSIFDINNRADPQLMYSNTNYKLPEPVANQAIYNGMVYGVNANSQLVAYSLSDGSFPDLLRSSSLSLDDATAAVAVGDSLFVGDHNELKKFSIKDTGFQLKDRWKSDLSNTTTSEDIQDFWYYAAINDLSWVDGYCVVAGGGEGLTTLDCSGSGDISLVSRSVDYTHDSTNLTVVDKKAFVSADLADFGEVSIFDITDLDTPYLAKTVAFDYGGSFYYVLKDSSILFQQPSSFYFSLKDLESGTVLIDDARAPWPKSNAGIASGNYIWLVGNELNVVDFANSEDPQLLNSLELGEQGKAITEHQDYLYIATASDVKGSVLVIDIVQPEQPKLVAVRPLLGNPKRLSVMDGRVAVTTDYGVEVFKIIER